MTKGSAERISRDAGRRAMVAAQSFGAGGTVREVLARSGFIRTLGGVDAYVALHARIPGFTRAHLEDAAAAGEAQVVPAVRACMYLIAREHVGLALRFAESVSAARAAREHAKAGIGKGEVEKVAKAALAVLRDRGPLATDALRRALPDGVVRSLGEAGKKLGISSPLPAALRRLEFDGVIERRVEGGRLDSERYVWRIRARSPFDEVPVPDDAARVRARMAEVFLRAAGLGTVRELAEWTGLPQRDAKEAAAALDTRTVEIEGVDEPHLVLSAERDRLLAKGADPVALVPFEDNVVHLHGGPALLTDEVHHAIPVPTWPSARGKPATLGESRHMAWRPVIAQGGLRGAWELDPARGQVVVALFGAGRRVPAGVTRAARDLGAFLTGELGHGRSFSLDTDDGLAARAAQLRELQNNS